MGKCEDDMEIRCIDHFRVAFAYPDLFVHSLTVRAVTVAAEIVMEIQMATVWTL